MLECVKQNGFVTYCNMSYNAGYHHTFASLLYVANVKYLQLQGMRQLICNATLGRSNVKILINSFRVELHSEHFVIWKTTLFI